MSHSSQNWADGIASELASTARQLRQFLLLRGRDYDLGLRAAAHVELLRRRVGASLTRLDDTSAKLLDTILTNFHIALSDLHAAGGLVHGYEGEDRMRCYEDARSRLDTVDDLAAQVIAALRSVPRTEADAAPSPDDLAMVRFLLARLPSVAQELAARPGSASFRIDDPHEIALLLRTVLLPFFADVRERNDAADEVAASYRTLVTRADRLVFTVHVGSGRSPAEIAQELRAAVSRCRDVGRPKRLFCLLWDPEGELAAAGGLEAELNSSGGELEVEIVVAPFGDLALRASPLER